MLNNTFLKTEYEASQDEPKTYWNRPILLLMTGRNGSSLVANLFHRHGVWVGESREGDKWNPDGYFENTEIKHELTETFGKDYLGPIPRKRPFKEKVFSILQKQQCSGRWLFKGGAFYLNAWHEFDPLYIKIKRSIGDTLDSYLRSRFLSTYDKDEIRTIISRQHDLMDRVEGPTIHAGRLFSKDYGELREAFEYCGLALNTDIADKIIR